MGRSRLYLNRFFPDGAVGVYSRYCGFFRNNGVSHHKEMAPKSPILERALKWLAFLCYVWLAGGLVIKFLF